MQAIAWTLGILSLCADWHRPPPSLSLIIWGMVWWPWAFASFGLLGGFLGNTGLQVTFKSSVPSELTAGHR